MTVNTRRIRYRIVEWASLWSVAQAERETFGITGAELVELCEAYEVHEHLEAQALSFARVILGNQLASDTVRKLAEQVVAEAKLRARKR